MPNNQETLVLVADDEPSTLALVAAHVRSKGFKVVEASDGDMAWQLAHEHLPDLVILDVMMPGMSGWEVCRKIRESLPLAHTGVIMLTGIGEHLNEMTSPLYGADTHVDKPFEFADLDDKIDATLRQRREGAFGRPDHADERDADDEEFDDDRRPVLTQPSPSLGMSADSSEDDEPAPHAVRLAPTGVRKAKRAAAWTDPVVEAGAGSAGKSTPKASKTQPAASKPAKPAKKAAAKTAEPSATKQATKKAAKKKATVKQATKKATAKKAVKQAIKKAPTKKAAKKATGEKATKKAPTKKAAKKVAKKATAKKATKKAPTKKAPTKKAAKKSGKRR